MTDTATSRTTLDRPARGILVSIVLAAIIAGVANTIIAASARAAGATSSTMGLMPSSLLITTVGAVIVGAFGWALITRFVLRSGRILAILVAVVLVVSLIPVIGLFASAATHDDVTAALGLGLMHVATLAAAVPIYRRFLRRR